MSALAAFGAKHIAKGYVYSSSLSLSPLLLFTRARALTVFLSPRLSTINGVYRVGRYTEMVMTSGKGSYVTTEGGKTWLDFTCGSKSPLLSHTVPRSAHFR